MVSSLCEMLPDGYKHGHMFFVKYGCNHQQQEQLIGEEDSASHFFCFILQTWEALCRSVEYFLSATAASAKFPFILVSVLSNTYLS